MESLRTHSATLFDGIEEDIKLELPSTFPLFDRLLEKAKKEGNINIALANSNLSELSKEIGNIDKFHTDIVFVLIRIHSLRHSTNNLFDVPYGGIRNDRNVEDKCDIEFDLLKFPSELQHILKQFMCLYKSPTSPKRNHVEETVKPVKSFMRRPFAKMDCKFCLRNISPAALDKEHNMQELLNFSQRSFSFTSAPHKKQITKIEQLGIVNERANKRVFYVPDSKMSTNNFCCCYCSRIVPRGWKPINIKEFIFCSFNCAKRFSKEEFHLLSIFEVKKEAEKHNYNLNQVKDSFSYQILAAFGGEVEDEEYHDVNEQYVSSFVINC
jgi:hypothetical protein